MPPRLLVGVDLGTQSLKAVVCDENLAVLGSHAVPVTTVYPPGGGAEQDPRAWDAALAPAIGGALAAAGATAADVVAVAFAGQLDGCVAVDASGHAVGPALIWQDRRAISHVACATAERVFDLTGQVADASHMAPKIRMLRAAGRGGARYHQPTTYLVERVTGVAAIDPAHASTTMLFDLRAGTWSRELLDAYEIAENELPALRGTCDVAGTLTAEGAALTCLVAHAGRGRHR